jgi:hypothetical protein
MADSTTPEPPAPIAKSNKPVSEALLNEKVLQAPLAHQLLPHLLPFPLLRRLLASIAAMTLPALTITVWLQEEHSSPFTLLPHVPMANLWLTINCK